MRRFAVITLIVVLLGTAAFFVVRRRQVWIGHEKIHEWSLSYAGQFSSAECRREVEKYGGYCSRRCVDSLRGTDCNVTVAIEPALHRRLFPG
jgi:hypothetical protein